MVGWLVVLSRMPSLTGSNAPLCSHIDSDSLTEFMAYAINQTVEFGLPGRISQSLEMVFLPSNPCIAKVCTSHLLIASLSTFRCPQLVHLRNSLLEFLVLALLVTMSLCLRSPKH